MFTRAEVEGVVGRLSDAPYRSRMGSSLADATGGSCSYRTPHHRVLVVTPIGEGGAAAFKLSGFAGKVVGRVIAQGQEADTLDDGPWDAAASGFDGTLLLLKGDALLQLGYRRRRRTSRARPGWERSGCRGCEFGRSASPRRLAPLPGAGVGIGTAVSCVASTYAPCGTYPDAPRPRPRVTLSEAKGAYPRHVPFASLRVTLWRAYPAPTHRGQPLRETLTRLPADVERGRDVLLRQADLPRNGEQACSVLGAALGRRGSGRL